MWGNRRHILGFDWADESVKAVRIRCGRGRPQVADFALRSVSDSAGLLTFFREARWGGRRGDVACAYTARDLHVRQLDLPEMSDVDLAASIPFEIRRHIPAGDSADRKVLHQVLARDKTTRRMSVLVCTAPEAGIEEARDRFLGTGVRPKRMEPAPLAAVNHMIHSGIAPDDDTCWGVLDVGATGSWLAFLKAGDALYVRSIHIGGSSFTQELVLRCRISREEADQVKRAEVSLGKIRPEWRSRTATLPSLLRNTLDGLAEEVSRHANRYRTKNGPVRRLFLGGGGALVHGLDQVLEHRLAIPVELVDPFRPFEIPAGWPERKRDLLSEIGPRFLVALGLTRWWRR